MSDVVLLVKEAPASVANTSDIAITHHLKWLDYQAFTMRNDFSETPLGCPLRLDCRVPESVTYVLWCSDPHSRDAFEQSLEEGQEVAFSSQAATGQAHDRPTTATTTHASPSRPRSRRASTSPESGAQPDSSPATTPPWLGSADRSVGSHLEARVERVRSSLSRSWKSRLGATSSSDRSSTGRAAMLLDTLESLKRQREARSSMRARKRGHDHGASGRSMDLAEAAAEVEATAGPGQQGSGLAGLLRLQQTGSTSWTALRDMLDVDVAKYVVPPQSESYAPIEKNSLRRYRIYKVELRGRAWRYGTFVCSLCHPFHVVRKLLIQNGSTSRICRRPLLYLCFQCYSTCAGGCGLAGCLLTALLAVVLPTTGHAKAPLPILCRHQPSAPCFPTSRCCYASTPSSCSGCVRRQSPARWVTVLTVVLAVPVPAALRTAQPLLLEPAMRMVLELVQLVQRVRVRVLVLRARQSMEAVRRRKTARMWTPGCHLSSPTPSPPSCPTSALTTRYARGCMRDTG